MNGKKDGRGTYTSSDGKKYIGQWKDDKYPGQGTFTWSDGRIFVGGYDNGKEFNGETHDKNGNVIVKFVNGKLE